MTDTQIKYWTLKETERSNRVNEAIKSFETDSKVQLNTAQTAKLREELNKVMAEVENIKMDTSLTAAEKQQKYLDYAQDLGDSLSHIMPGSRWVESFASSFFESLGSTIGGGVGKAAGKSLIG